MNLISITDKIKINREHIVYIVDETKSAIVKPGEQAGDGLPVTKIIFASGLFVCVRMEFKDVVAIVEGDAGNERPRINLS